MSSWLVSLCPSWVWRCTTITLGGATCHQVSACPSQEWWPVGHVILSGTLIVSGMAHANSGELADHLMFVFSPFPPRYQQMLILRQNRMGKRFIHLPSPPDIMSLAGKCNSCADLFCDISPPDIMLLAGNWISYEGPFFDRYPLFLRNGDRHILGGRRAIEGRRWWTLMIPSVSVLRGWRFRVHHIQRPSRPRPPRRRYAAATSAVLY